MSHDPSCQRRRVVCKQEVVDNPKGESDFDSRVSLVDGLHESAMADRKIRDSGACRQLAYLPVTTYTSVLPDGGLWLSSRPIAEGRVVVHLFIVHMCLCAFLPRNDFMAVWWLVVFQPSQADNLLPYSPYFLVFCSLPVYQRAPRRLISGK